MTEATPTAATSPGPHEVEHDAAAMHVHVSSPQLLLAIWAVLAVLTLATVLAARVDLGSLNLWLALLIAGVKGSLVLLFFMHLLYERPFNAIVLMVAVLVVLLFIGLTLIDTIAYHSDLIRGYAPALER